MIIRMLLCVTMIIFFIGCTPTKEVITVKEYETVVIAPPAHLTKAATAPAPEFTPELYATAAPAQREEMLDQLISKLYVAIELANNRLGSIREWVERQEALYEKKPKNGVKNE